MTRDEAVAFFSSFYGGTHHIPSGHGRGASGVKDYGNGWSVVDHSGELATFDFDGLTRLVLLAHERRYRVGVSPAGRFLRISVWKRASSGSVTQRHPDVEEMIDAWRARPLPKVSR